MSESWNNDTKSFGMLISAALKLFKIVTFLSQNLAFLTGLIALLGY